ncbi:MAG: alpha/beta hydrolase [Sphingobium sp.]
MSTRHLVAPELLPILDAFPPLSFSCKTLPMMRAAQAAMMAQRPSSDMPGVTVTDRAVPGRNGAPDVRIIEYRPTGASASLPVFLHIHGGGHIVGAPEMNDARNATLATTLGCVVISVDYRLSPEAPYPAAIDDCYAALEWLNDQAGALGIDPARITVGGESAGGGLAAGLALMARDLGVISLHSQLLIYPMLDDRAEAASSAHTGEFIWTREHNRFGWASLLGDHAAAPPPYAAPARAGDLAGLPESFIAVGALDLFLDEDIDYARRLMAAGVPVSLHVVPGAFHGFDGMSAGPLAAGFTKLYVDWLARIWAADAQASAGGAAIPA